MNRLKNLFITSEGKKVIVQSPNVPIVLFLIFTAGYWMFSDMQYSTLLQVLARGSLTIWAGLEAAQGVNTFRRLLGVAALAYLLAVVGAQGAAI